GEASATWSTGPGAGFARGARFPGNVDLAGKLTQARAASTARYLPLGIPEDPRQYVARAVQAGANTPGTFKVTGDLWDFPHAGVKQGEFHIAGKVEGVTLAYVPGEGSEPPRWPPFDKVSAELVFDRSSMEIRNAQAQVYGVALSQIQAAIRDMGSKHPLLTVQGNGRGPLADMLRYVNASPVAAWTQQSLAQSSAIGAADLKLALSLPLEKIADSTVKGSVVLAGNDVRISPDTPLLGAARARVEFTGKGVTVSGGSARVLGGDATFEGRTAAD